MFNQPHINVSITPSLYHSLYLVNILSNNLPIILSHHLTIMTLIHEEVFSPSHFLILRIFKFNFYNLGSKINKNDNYIYN